MEPRVQFFLTRKNRAESLPMEFVKRKLFARVELVAITV